MFRSLTLTYNLAGRLAAVMAWRNSAAQYTYDAFGQRLEPLGRLHLPGEPAGRNYFASAGQVISCTTTGSARRRPRE